MFEMNRDTVKLKYVPSEYSDQPAHLRSLIRVFTRRIIGSQFPNDFYADSEDSDQIERVRSLIRVSLFAYANLYLRLDTGPFSRDLTIPHLDLFVLTSFLCDNGHRPINAF